MDTGLALIYGLDISSELIFKPIVQLAAHQSIFVVDGENSFRSYRIARYARAQNLDVRRVLSNVRVSRAFTCYQLAELIVKLSHMNLDGCAGIVCLGLLGTFYDEDVTLIEARRLLQATIVQLKSLSDRVPILITVRQSSSSIKTKGRLSLVNLLMQHVDEVRVLPAREQPLRQLQLAVGRSNGPHQ